MQIKYHCAERTVEVEENEPTILEVSTASKIRICTSVEATGAVRHAAYTS